MSKRYTPIDPFSSRYDSVTSIGALDVLVPSIIGLDFQLPDPKKELDKAAKSLKDSVKDAIKENTKVDVEKGDFAAPTKAITRGAQAAIDLITGGKKDPYVEAQLTELAKITDNPVLQAGIAAVAVVPVVGPVIAGITYAMLEVAGPVMQLATALEDAFHSGESDNERAFRKAFQAYEARNGVLYDKPRRDMRNYSVWRIAELTGNPMGGAYSSEKEAQKALDKAKKEKQAFLDGWKGTASKAGAAKLVNEFAITLAPLVGAADAGDTTAIKALTTAQVGLSKELAEARDFLKKSAAGFEAINIKSALSAWPKWDTILDVARGKGSDKTVAKKAKDAWQEAFNATKKALTKALKAPKKNVADRVKAKVEETLAEAAKSLKEKAAKAAKERGGIVGDLVGLYYTVTPGRWEQVNSGGTFGALVTASGKAIVGRFKAV